MSEFKSKLLTRLKDDESWILTEDMIYNSDLVGKVVVPAGFETDLASVPRLPIIYTLWGSRAHREAVVHDYLFRVDSVPLVSFNEANLTLLESMTCLGKPWYIRYPMYWGVCFGSYPFYHKYKVEDSV